MVRSHAEWADHPQAQAIAALPLMEIVRIGDSDPEPLASRQASAFRHPGGGCHPCAGRADLCPHAG